MCTRALRCGWRLTGVDDRVELLRRTSQRQRPAMDQNSDQRDMRRRLAQGGNKRRAVPRKLDELPVLAFTFARVVGDPRLVVVALRGGTGGGVVQPKQHDDCVGLARRRDSRTEGVRVVALHRITAGVIGHAVRRFRRQRRRELREHRRAPLADRRRLGVWR